ARPLWESAIAIVVGFSIIVVPGRPPPEGTVAVAVAGRSPGSRINAAIGLPGVTLQWLNEGSSPLTVAGAAAALARPSPRSLLRPAAAGTHGAEYSHHPLHCQPPLAPIYKL